MSQAQTDFASTPVVIGNRPTTYGELRADAQRTIEATTYESVALAMMVDKELTPGAIKGAMMVILSLLGEIERLTGDAE